MQNLVWLGVFIQIISVSAYVRDMLRGKAKPNRITWLFWGIAPIIGALAAISNGAGWAALPTLTTGILPLVIFILSFTVKGSYWRLERFDYFCGLFSALALILWYLTRDPGIAVFFAILSDAAATVPTLIKTWKYPETESTLSYLFSCLGIMTSFFALSRIDFTSLAFPLYLTMVDFSITLLSLRKSHRAVG